MLSTGETVEHIVLANRAFGHLLDTQTLKKHPQDTQIILWGIFFYLHIVTMTLYKDIIRAVIDTGGIDGLLAKP